MLGEEDNKEMIFHFYIVG